MSDVFEICLLTGDVFCVHEHSIPHLIQSVKTIFGYLFRAHRVHKTQLDTHRFMFWQDIPDVSQIIRANTDRNHVSICVNTREQWEDLADWLDMMNTNRANQDGTLWVRVDKNTVDEDTIVFELLNQLYTPAHLKWSCHDNPCAFQHFTSVKSLDLLDKIRLFGDLVTTLCRMPMLEEVVLPSGTFYDCDYNEDGYVWKQWGQQLASCTIQTMYVRFWVDMLLEESRLVKWLEWIQRQWSEHWIIEIDYNDTKNRVSNGMHVLESVRMVKRNNINAQELSQTEIDTHSHFRNANNT